MTAELLKPCPFCSGPVEVWMDGGEFFIRCAKCGGRTGRQDTEPEAISAWNRRAEQLGNSDELWDWLARRIRNVTYGYQKAADGYYYRDGYHDALEWVLSLKKENK